MIYLVIDKTWKISQMLKVLILALIESIDELGFAQEIGRLGKSRDLTH